MIHLISTKEIIFNAKTSESAFLHLFVDAFVENYAQDKFTIDCRFCVGGDELVQIEQTTFEVDKELLNSTASEMKTEAERRADIASKIITYTLGEKLYYGLAANEWAAVSEE